MTTAGKNRIMIYGREDRRYLHHRIQDGRGRGVNDLCAGALIILATVISAVYWVELAARGYLNECGVPFSAASMLTR
jgi:hypothetical protein